MSTNITLADLTSCADGMVLVAKDNVDGSRRHISKVANGLRCGCVCFGCERALVARNGGDVKRHHFAHQPDEVTANCATAGETALHILAKEIIARHRRVTLPATSVLGIDGKTVEVTAERSIDLTDVRLEVVTGEVVPDVAATMPDGRRIFIEIANTHLCRQEKIEKLDAMGVEVLEIRVSEYKDHSLDDLDGIILDIAPRRLLLCSEVKAIAARIAEDRKWQEDEKIAAAEGLVAVYRDPLIRNHKKAQLLAEDLVQLGLSDFLDLEDDRPSAFIIYRRQWQAVILDRLYKAKSELLTPMDFLETFANGKWPKPEIAYTKSEHSKWIAANVAEEFKSPYEEVHAYLVRLRRDGAVREISGKRFGMEHDLRQRITASMDRRELPGHRTRELKVAFRNIAALMAPEDGRLPNFDLWLKGRAESFGSNVEDFLADADGDFDELADQLAAVEKMIEDMQRHRDVDPPDDMAGLPMDRLVNRLGLARIEAQERAEAEMEVRRQRREAETAARLKLEAEERVSKVEKAAIIELDHAKDFLRTQLLDLGGKTPRELAAESLDGLIKVQAVLWKMREDRDTARRTEDLRKRMVGQLQERVYSRIVRRKVADLWLSQRWPALGGVKLVDYCVDEKTLARCIVVLEEFVAGERKRGRR